MKNIGIREKTMTLLFWSKNYKKKRYKYVPKENTIKLFHFGVKTTRKRHKEKKHLQIKK